MLLTTESNRVFASFRESSRVIQVMKKCFSWSLGRIGIVLLLVTMGISAASLCYSAPSEENISGSSSLRTPAASGVGDAESRLSEPSSDNPGTEESYQGRTGDEGDQSAGAVSSEGSVSSPRVFPYTRTFGRYACWYRGIIRGFSGRPDEAESSSSRQRTHDWGHLANTQSFSGT